MYRRKILVAEDDTEWRKLLEVCLRSNGYRVFLAASGKEVPPLAEQCRPDCILLDFELGDQTALEVCQVLRSKAPLEAIPVVILTAHAEEKLHAYRNCKADHFILKDGRNSEELLAVLEATWHRLDKDRKILEKGDISLDPEGYGVYHNNRLVASPSREQFIFLYVLIQRSPDSVSYQDIFELVMHEHYPGANTDAIRSLVRRLRKELGGLLARRIKSIKGIGWVYSSSRIAASRQINLAAPAHR